MKGLRVRKKWVRWILPAVSAAVLALHAKFFAAASASSARPPLLFAALCVSVFLLNLFAWRTIGRVCKESALAREQALREHRMEHVVRMSRQARENEERVLRFHHDLKNHFGVLYSLLQEGNREQAGSYIEQMRAALERKDGTP